MSEKVDRVLIIDIIDAIEAIESFIVSMDENEFIIDRKTSDAVIKNLMVIGEASNKLSISFRVSNSQIQWHLITGMRNRLVHDYQGTSLPIVWQICVDDLPKFKQQLLAIKFD